MLSDRVSQLSAGFISDVSRRGAEELLVAVPQNIEYLELCTQASISLGLYDKAEEFV